VERIGAALAKNPAPRIIRETHIQSACEKIGELWALAYDRSESAVTPGPNGHIDNSIRRLRGDPTRLGAFRREFEPIDVQSRTQQASALLSNFLTTGGRACRAKPERSGTVDSLNLRCVRK
jgi:hypothetical protein